MEAFEITLDQFLKKTMIKAEDALAKITLSIFTDIVFMTPVDLGTARANWLPSWGSPLQAIREAQDPTGSSKASEIKTFVLTGDPVDDRWSAFLSNSLPYIENLEYGLYPSPSKSGKTVGGFSIQAPAGMVRVTLIKWSESRIGSLIKS